MNFVVPAETDNSKVKISQNTDKIKELEVLEIAERDENIQTKSLQKLDRKNPGHLRSLAVT